MKQALTSTVGDLRLSDLGPILLMVADMVPDGIQSEDGDSPVKANARHLSKRMAESIPADRRLWSVYQAWCRKQRAS